MPAHRNNQQGWDQVPSCKGGGRDTPVPSTLSEFCVDVRGIKDGGKTTLLQDRKTKGTHRPQEKGGGNGTLLEKKK